MTASPQARFEPLPAVVLVYDGDCGICSASARWVQRHCDGIETRTHRECGLDHIDKVRLRTPTRALEGAPAVAAVLQRASPAPYRLAGWALATPPLSWVAAGGYWLIARNRHRLSRWLQLPACTISAPISGSDDSGPIQGP